MTDIIMVLLKNVLAKRSDIKVQCTYPQPISLLKYGTALTVHCTGGGGGGGGGKDLSENSRSGSIYDP
jgi:hypothetical protein